MQCNQEVWGRVPRTSAACILGCVCVCVCVCVWTLVLEYAAASANISMYDQP